MNSKPSNLYHFGQISEERELAAICQQHGYVLSRFVYPSLIIETNTFYYLIREGGTKLAGGIAVGQKMEWWHAFEGTLDEFLDSLETYEERFTAWDTEQKYAIAEMFANGAHLSE